MKVEVETGRGRAIVVLDTAGEELELIIGVGRVHRVVAYKDKKGDIYAKLEDL